MAQKSRPGVWRGPSRMERRSIAARRAVASLGPGVSEPEPGQNPHGHPGECSVVTAGRSVRAGRGGVRSFGDLEAAIMDRIWSAGQPLLVRDVQRTLTPQRAYNTVLTVV